MGWSKRLLKGAKDMKTVKSGGPKRKNQTITTKRHVPTERRVAAAIARNPLKATGSHRFLPGAGLPAYVAARSLLYVQYMYTDQNSIFQPDGGFSIVFSGL